jgi:hypothetical protein
MPTLVCPLCGEMQSPNGPGVGSRRDEDVPQSEWESYWVPFIEDLRGTPGRLVHPECFAEERGLDALVSLVTDHDRRMRLEASAALVKLKRTLLPRVAMPVSDPLGEGSLVI